MKQNEFGFDEDANIAAREVRLMWDVYPCAHTMDIKKHIQMHLNELDPASFEERIRILSMFNDGNTETCVHSAREVAAFAARFKPGHRCFLVPKSEKTWWNENPNKSQGHWDIVASQMVHTLKCRTSHPTCPATAPLLLGQLKNGGPRDHFQGTVDNTKILIKFKLAGSLLSIYNCVCQWYETEKEAHTQRKPKKEEELDFEPSS